MVPDLVSHRARHDGEYAVKAEDVAFLVLRMRDLEHAVRRDPASFGGDQLITVLTGADDLSTAVRTAHRARSQAARMEVYGIRSPHPEPAPEPQPGPILPAAELQEIAERWAGDPYADDVGERQVRPGRDHAVLEGIRSARIQIPRLVAEVLRLRLALDAGADRPDRRDVAIAAALGRLAQHGDRTAAELAEDITAAQLAAAATDDKEGCRAPVRVPAVPGADRHRLLRAFVRCDAEGRQHQCGEAPGHVAGGVGRDAAQVRRPRWATP